MKQFFGYAVGINFFSFILGAMYFGGDALNGKEKDGHFFLASHGKFTQVSESVFSYSKLHAMSVLVSIGLLVIFHYFGKTE
ncbi:hypothetical protein [Rugamonas aquatica]|uniref:Uncharacterized protein n=1 Tax=Rugamonas aquatica TaxID=2743357 RepID=A0A6A7MYG9_9BURK|nr:hypothetical protein [Rugamonas aquatica]MQA37780.1 hypothetical protein [Rugamonas aquatica]